MSARHITVSQRIIRKHLHRPHIDIAQAQDIVKRAALHAHTGEELGLDKQLREALERATGVSITELALISEEWA